ncbi:histidine phosphatase family protein [Williamsia sp. CHRR-6]|uniref:histidine phosphatase family protein n=1 Tax=Williamsia sp. CHRR-6 TaxID=2835871 RepID=UPI001BD99D1E|nr:histidine phosphatase family protein [Williamsia sp. CHRR-6]MBT0567539.1 histidine phosphatase family protein [Williamsia sp. CHRR-6]
MGVLYLVRHGQARAGAYGSGALDDTAGGLTELGRRQAVRVGQSLAARVQRVDHAVSGALARQRETAALALAEIGAAATPLVHAGFDEYDLGSVTAPSRRDQPTASDPLAPGPSGKAFQTGLDDGLRAWIAGTIDGGGSYADYRARCAATLDDVAAQAGSGQTVVAFSSAGTITAMIATIWGLDDERWITLSRTMINTSISKLLCGRSGISVVSINDHTHVDVAADRTLMTFR